VEIHHYQSGEAKIMTVRAGKKIGKIMEKNRQYYKFGLYGFFKNLRFYESFLILFFLEKGIDYLKIGLLYSIREITVALLEVPSGLIADALGRKKTLIASFAIYILSFISFYFARHYFVMLVAMVFFAIADALRTGVHKAMIFQYLKSRKQANHKTEYYGHTRSWSQTGSAVSALLAGGMAFYYGSYKIMFAASVIPYLLDMILIGTYPAFLDGETQTLNTKSVLARFKIVLKSLVKSFRSLILLRSLTSLSLHTGYYKAVKDYIQPVIMGLALSLPIFTQMKNQQKTALLVGIIYFFIYLLTAWTSRHAGSFQKRFQNYSKPMNLSIITGFIIGLLSGLFFYGQWYLAAIFGFLFIMMIENLRKPIGIAYVADQSEDEAMASILSVQSQAQSLFAAIVALVIGFTAKIAGPGIGIALSSMILLILSPLYLLKHRK